ncbi:hypothetical protein EVAR_73387_1, partial [Eumeta japonica]
MYSVRRISPLSSSSSSSLHINQNGLSPSTSSTPWTSSASVMGSAFDYPPIPKVHKVSSKLPANYERTDK